LILLGRSIILGRPSNPLLPFLRCTKLSGNKYEAELKCEYDFDKDIKKRWCITLDRESILEIPTDLMERLGWKDDDVLEFFDTGVEEFLLVKIVKS